MISNTISYCISCKFFQCILYSKEGQKNPPRYVLLTPVPLFPNVSHLLPTHKRLFVTLVYRCF